MKSGTQAALGLAVGYVLGRRRKLRLAIMLGAGAMTGGLASAPGQLLKQGTQMLGSTDTLGKLGPGAGQVAEMVKGDLLEAAKAAGMAAVTSRIDRLSDRLHDQAEGLRRTGGGEQDDAEPGGRDEGYREDGEPEDEAGEEPYEEDAEPAAYQDGDDDEYGDDEYGDDEEDEEEDRDDEDEGTDEPSPRRRGGRAERAGTQEAGEPDDRGSAPRRAPAAKRPPTRQSAPARRTRR